MEIVFQAQKINRLVYIYSSQYRGVTPYFPLLATNLAPCGMQVEYHHADAKYVSVPPSPATATAYISGDPLVEEVIKGKAMPFDIQRIFFFVGSTCYNPAIHCLFFPPYPTSFISRQYVHSFLRWRDSIFRFKHKQFPFCNSTRTRLRGYVSIL